MHMCGKNPLSTMHFQTLQEEKHPRWQRAREEMQTRRTKPSISSQFHSKNTHSITDVESVPGCEKLHAKRNPHKIHEELTQPLFDGTSQSNTTASQSPGGEHHGPQSFPFKPELYID